MAVWVDVSYLECPSDEENNVNEYGCHVKSTKLYSPPKASTRDSSSYREHNTITPAAITSEQKDICSFSDFEISVPDVPGAAAEYYCQYMCDALEPSNAAEEVPSHGICEEQTNTDRKLDILNMHGITFMITSPDDTTVTIPSDYEEETPLLHTADTESTQNLLSYNTPDSHDNLNPTREYSNAPNMSIELEGSHNSQKDLIGLGIETEEAFQQPTPRYPLVLTTEADEKITFFDIYQDDFDRLLATSHACNDVEPADETSDFTEVGDHWVEFDYQYHGDLAQNTQEFYSRDGISIAAYNEEGSGPAFYHKPGYDTENADVYGPFDAGTWCDFEDGDSDHSIPLHDSQQIRKGLHYFASRADEYDFGSDFHPEDSSGIDDVPLSAFQPLPIGPYSPPSPPTPPLSPFYIEAHRFHHHATGRWVDPHWTDLHPDCAILKFMVTLAEDTGVYVPLGRRVYEIRGVLEESRRSRRESIEYRRWWRESGRVGSPLSVGWVADGLVGE